jgi:DNA polymerase
MDPKKINDWIIVKGKDGWQYSSLFRKIPLNNYDVMGNVDRGLKWFEGSMGSMIKESSISFDTPRKLTEAEIQETVKYCRHDVEETIKVFLKRIDDFNAHMGLVKLACEGQPLDLSLIGKTKAQLSAHILKAQQKPHDDEFDIDFPDTLVLKKYTNVLDWYEDPENRCYKKPLAGRKTEQKTQLETMVAGCPHQFGWGGVHGALEKYNGTGLFLMCDVASLYPSLMIRYNLHSRNMEDPKKYEEIYHTRLKYKKEKNPLQAPLKLVLNSTYGVMKDKGNGLYDPLQANRVCVYGQLLLLDLIEKLEPHCQLIQSNTDGILIRMPDGQDPNKWYEKIDDLAYEWEQRTGLVLEFDEYIKVFQADVNNYIVVSADGKYKSKGAYVKKLSDLDYGDFPIVNKALVEYMVKGIPVEQTINNCDQLKEFQMVTKIGGKYKHLQHGTKILNEKCVRVFASTRSADRGLTKVSIRTGKPEKVASSPERCFMWNDAIDGVKVPDYLDKQWYVDLANRRLKEKFGL